MDNSNSLVRHETEGQEEQQAGSELLASGAKNNPPFKKSHSLNRPQHGGSGVTPKKALMKAGTLGETLALDQNSLSRVRKEPNGGFLPPAIQTTAAFSPDFQIGHNRDTRPQFLGGQY